MGVRRESTNTHQSAGLVQWVAERCGVPDDLGRKGASGILRDMASRKACLEDGTHRVRFVYTPRHGSWLNQVEIWFSLLSRRLLRRASFAPTEEHPRLHQGLNATLAKPFRWTYIGKPLVAGVIELISGGVVIQETQRNPHSLRLP